MSFYRGDGGSGSGSVTTEPVQVSEGGTGATTAVQARTNLGLGTIATQDSSNVSITGGTIVTSNATITGGAITGITDLAIADGGTGASTASAARTNLGLSTVAATGDYNDLSNKPSVPSALDDLTDVTLSSPSDGQVLKYNGTAWVNSVDNVNNGDVVGPNSATDSAVALFDGTTGLLLKDSAKTLPSGDILGTDAVGVSVQAYDSNLTSFVSTFTLPTSDGTNGQVLKTNGSGTLSFVTAGAGTVTSVDMTVPTGLSVANNPITSSGTLAITYASGYAIPTTASQSNWDTAYGWGNHASAGYLTSAAIGSTVQGYDADTAKYDDVTANFSGTLQNGGSNVVVDSDIGVTVQAYDSTILKSADIGVTVQGYDADTAKYDDVTANFTGTLQKSGNDVLTTASTISGGTY